MIGDGNKKKNLWSLAVAIGICIAAMFLDGVGISIDPVLSGIMLIAAILLLFIYVISNYTKNKRE